MLVLFFFWLIHLVGNRRISLILQLVSLELNCEHEIVFVLNYNNQYLYSLISNSFTLAPLIPWPSDMWKCELLPYVNLTLLRPTTDIGREHGSSHSYIKDIELSISFIYDYQISFVVIFFMRIKTAIVKGKSRNVVI